MEKERNHTYITRYRQGDAYGTIYEFMREEKDDEVAVIFNIIASPYRKMKAIEVLEQAELIVTYTCDTCDKLHILPTLAGLEWVDNIIDQAIEQSCHN